MDATVVKQLRRVRTLGRGSSGAVVWLASDDDSGKLLAVKSAVAGGAALLRREGRVLSGLCSPHIVPCLGCRAAAGGEYQLFLEFAPGGSLADEAARSGGRLPEPAIRAYVGDVARGLAYLHARSLVHGDVKARNVVIGGDGRARLTDFGCARAMDSGLPIGGTPAFMAPEVARGEEQGPAADVWALGCTVIEMATGRAPWSDMDDILAAVHRIGYTDSVPEVPMWLSAEAKDFLDGCFRRHPTTVPRWRSSWIIRSLPPPPSATARQSRRSKNGRPPRAHCTTHSGTPTPTTRRTRCRRARPTGSGHWRVPPRPCRTGTPTKAGSTCTTRAPRPPTRRRPTRRPTRTTSSGLKNQTRSLSNSSFLRMAVTISRAMQE